MCTTFIAYDSHPEYSLILVSNRDEFYARQTLPMQWWPENTQILAGKDLDGHGTWLGVNSQGYWANLTNIRDPKTMDSLRPSRGIIISDFLSGKHFSPKNYFSSIQPRLNNYNGFNLLLGDAHSTYYFNNQQKQLVQLSPGIYGLSNGLLDTAWPKVVDGKKIFSDIIKAKQPFDPGILVEMMQDPKSWPDEQLPRTGVSMEWERLLSARFIRNENYGTRQTTVLFIHRQGKINVTEISYDPTQASVNEKHFQFEIDTNP